MVDPEDGRVVGVAPAYKRAPICDREAILRAAGEQNADLARKMLPVRGRHQQEAEARLAMIGRNADVLSGRVRPQQPFLGDGASAPLDDMQSDNSDDFWGEEDADPVLDELLQASYKE